MNLLTFSLMSSAVLTLAKESPHPVCADMHTYQAPYVATEYDINRHMGHYYELGFRDL